MISLSLLQNKRKFLLQVFATLIVQLGITYYIMERVDVAVYQKTGFWTFFILQLSIIFALNTDIHPVFKFILFSMFSGISGLQLTNLKKTYDPIAIKTAIESALGIFSAMFAFGISLVLLGVQFGAKVGIALFLCVIALIIARTISIVSNTTSKLFSVITVILFSAYVVYDTNIMLQRNYYGDFITAALSYYLDILNLFTGTLGDE